jgi:phosphoribosylformimino-5-aminoimidazole carboxamide ribotide isomerase
MGDFTVFPAIDLRGGQVVRLKEGDPGRQTTYSADPGATARRWLELGARWLHVVNLDGAFGEGDDLNRGALASVLAEASLKGGSVQFGGGLRSLEAARQALSLGVGRVVLGTLAVEQPGILAQLLAEFGPERIAAGLDAREGRVAVHGWQVDSGEPVLEAAQQMADLGVQWVIFTDIARDGMQRGINLEATRALADATKLKVIASGGAARLEEIEAVRSAGLAGVIVGKALYDGMIDPVRLLALEQRSE